MTENESSSLHVLTANNIKKTLNDKLGCGMLLVHAEWCGHCKHLMPEYIDFANSMPCFTTFAITNDELGNVSASDKKLFNLPTVNSFPTLFSIKNNKCGAELNLEERTKVGLIAEAMNICPGSCKCNNNACKAKK